MSCHTLPVAALLHLNQARSGLNPKPVNEFVVPVPLYVAVVKLFAKTGAVLGVEAKAAYNIVPPFWFIGNPLR